MSESRWELLNEIDTQLSFLKSSIHLLNILELGDDEAAFIIEGLQVALAKLAALQATSWEIAKKEHPPLRLGEHKMPQS
jgi:hypothetical protein